MKLAELYQNTPLERHFDIKIIGNEVIIYNQDGSQELYLLDEEGDMWPVMSQASPVFQVDRPLMP